MGRFFKGIWGIIKLIFGSSKDKEEVFRKYKDYTLEVIKVIDSVINNPLLDLVTELTKTTLDDQALKIFREVIFNLNKSIFDSEKIDDKVFLTDYKKLNNYEKEKFLNFYKVSIFKNAVEKRGYTLSSEEANKLLDEQNK